MNLSRIIVILKPLLNKRSLKYLVIIFIILVIDFLHPNTVVRVFPSILTQLLS